MSLADVEVPACRGQMIKTASFYYMLSVHQSLFTAIKSLIIKQFLSIRNLAASCWIIVAQDLLGKCRQADSYSHLKTYLVLENSHPKSVLLFSASLSSSPCRPLRRDLGHSSWLALKQVTCDREHPSGSHSLS